ncbi:hypothetical protein [Brevundimonas sp.]|uniref:hypothetical protein n=1 Tax=Brevundimonas sp. TaxID=1871086 RepID=UPI00391B0A63
MPGKGLVDKVVAAAIAAACAFVAIVALGATLFYVLLMVVPAAAAAAITAGVAALAALIIAMTFLNKANGDEGDDEEPAGLGERAFVLFRNRPVLATVAALAGGWIFLRNPALASMVAAAFTESSRGRR